MTFPSDLTISFDAEGDDVVMCRDCGKTVKQGAHSVSDLRIDGQFSATYCDECARWRESRGLLFDPRLRSNLARRRYFIK